MEASKFSTSTFLIRPGPSSALRGSETEIVQFLCRTRETIEPERPREAQRGPERPTQRLREAQRGPERPREAQIGPERPREARKGPEMFREAVFCSVIEYIFVKIGHRQWRPCYTHT